MKSPYQISNVRNTHLILVDILVRYIVEVCICKFMYLHCRLGLDDRGTITIIVIER